MNCHSYLDELLAKAREALAEAERVAKELNRDRMLSPHDLRTISVAATMARDVTRGRAAA